MSKSRSKPPSLRPRRRTSARPAEPTEKERPATKEKAPSTEGASAPPRGYRPAVTLRMARPTFDSTPPEEEAAKPKGKVAVRPRAKQNDTIVIDRSAGGLPQPPRSTADSRSDGPAKRASTRPRANARVDAVVGTSIPSVKVSPQELMKLRLDSRAGFVLANIDGRTNVNMLVDLTSLLRVEVEAILLDLIDKGVVRLSHK